MCGNGGNAGGWLTAAGGAVVSDWFIHTNRKTRPFKDEKQITCSTPIDKNSQATIRNTQGKIHKTSTTPRATHHIV